jgi:hypothetical protein
MRINGNERYFGWEVTYRGRVENWHARKHISQLQFGLLQPENDLP